MELILEWAGAAFGISGAALLSSNVRLSPYGWLLFMCSSLLLCLYAVLVQAWGLLLLNGCFVATNLNGIFRCWLPYYRASRAPDAKMLVKGRDAFTSP
ncbi:hypothetical protein [Stutzerimonas stutzeri]|uniref:hypothetical protein n=1 Tax=Stutzerimonas stutzeri TaxID=316 RepID=UPI00265CD93C|nr:hypothetical protein [Stutzerimonas stutzeri]MCF6783731.1 hypothetical protein [Stutzerimonas stutzeri]